MHALDRASDSIAPALLLSMPQLSDPNFRQTVVLLCQHSAEGAWGLVLNRPTGRSAAMLVQLDPPVTSDNGLELWIGGPVEAQRGCLLLGENLDENECVEVCDGLYISGSPTLLRRLMEGPARPRTRLLIGYAGWGPGQLDEELKQSAWLLSDVPVDLIFDGEPEGMWEAAIRRLGCDPGSLHMSFGVH